MSYHSRPKFLAIASALLAAAVSVYPPTARAQVQISLYDASVRALKNTPLNYPDSAPFHVKISVVDSHPDTNRHATIEMWWMSPTKYRRVIESPDFSQTRIVNGEAVSEENKATYYPYWLQEVVDGFFDPIPFLESLRQVPRMLPASPPPNMRLCGDIPFRVDRWIICFQQDHKDELQSVFTKGYAIQYFEYHKFAHKSVAHKLITHEDREHSIASTISTLEPLENPDESLFAVTTLTPAAQQFRSLQVSEDAFRKLAIGSMDVAWPMVVGGSGKGGCAVFVSADRDGNVREGFYGGCDNAALEEPLRLAALKWKLHPAVQNGAPVQVTALLGIPYDIHVEPAHDVILSEADARKLASNTVEPVFPRGTKRGTVVSIQVSIDDDGRFLEASNPSGASTDLFLPAVAAVEKWKFTSYVQDGKPIPFKSTVTFTAP
jgi:hypothetical protein